MTKAQETEHLSTPLTSPGVWRFEHRLGVDRYHLASVTTVVSKTFFDARKQAAIRLGAPADTLILLSSPFTQVRI